MGGLTHKYDSRESLILSAEPENKRVMNKSVRAGVLSQQLMMTGWTLLECPPYGYHQKSSLTDLKILKQTIGNFGSY